MEQENNRKNAHASTRVWAPRKKTGSTFPLLEEDTPQSQIVKPQPTEEDARPAVVNRRKPMPMSSRILIIVSLFLMAGTAILGLAGSAEVSAVYSEISTIDSEITTYEENISQLKKEQNSLNDYNSINDVNRSAGRTMIWDMGQ